MSGILQLISEHARSESQLLLPALLRQGSESGVSAAPAPTVFIHIPKTGGTSLLHIAKAMCVHFGGESLRMPVPLHPPVLLRPGWQGAWEQSRDYFNTQESLPAFFSAHAPYGFHRGAGQRVRAITLLREPVAREISSFNHHVERGVLQAGDSLAALTESGFLTDNPQTRICAGIESCRVERCGTEEFERAKQQLGEFFLVGVYEEYDEFVSAVMALNNWPAVRYSAQRVTQRPTIVQADAALQETLRRVHHYDCLLHQHAQELWRSWKQKNLLQRTSESQPQSLLEIPWHFALSNRVRVVHE